jgi:hypothetical protein
VKDDTNATASGLSLAWLSMVSKTAATSVMKKLSIAKVVRSLSVTNNRKALITEINSPKVRSTGIKAMMTRMP